MSTRTPTTEPDALSTWMQGEPAMRLAAKMLVRPGLPILIAGSALRLDDPAIPLLTGRGAYERWDCEVILLPRAKFRGPDREGARVDQLLCGGFDSDGFWKEQYWKAGP